MEGDPTPEDAARIFDRVPVPPEMVDAAERTIRDNLPPGRPSPTRVTLTAWRILDDLLAQDPNPPACRRGCWFCCTMMVHVFAVEAKILASRVRDRGTRGRLAANAEAAAGLDTADYTRAKIRCAFLTPNGECGVYDVRPWACRWWHSADAKACEAGLGVAHTPIPLHEGRLCVTKVMMMGAGGILTDRGARPPQDVIGRPSEMHAAVLRAWRRR